MGTKVSSYACSSEQSVENDPHGETSAEIFALGHTRPWKAAKIIGLAHKISECKLNKAMPHAGSLGRRKLAEPTAGSASGTGGSHVSCSCSYQTRGDGAPGRGPVPPSSGKLLAFLFSLSCLVAVSAWDLRICMFRNVKG